MGLSKKILLRVVLIAIIVFLVGFLAIKLLFNSSGGNEEGLIEIVHLDPQKKMDTADYLVLNNTLYQKGLETSKTLSQVVNEFMQGSVSQVELQSAITKSNKQLTYYYLVAIQSQPTDVVEHVSKDMNYDLYQMRRGSEELLKYTEDKSSLRLYVGLDLLGQAISEEVTRNTQVATEMARYAIEPSTVVISEDVWEKEYTFIQETPDMVIFNDIETTDKESYAYYLKYVNDTFMLVSWELQNIYLSKIDYVNDSITKDQLSTKLDGSGYIILTSYDELELLEAPEGLGKLEEDTRKTMLLYKDALLEIQKFSMTGDTKHFDDAMVIINQADIKAQRIGEFIYAVQRQYGL